MKKNKILNVFGVLLIPIIIFAVFKSLQPARFGNVDSMLILFQQCLLPSVTASGLYFIIVMGLFDFSIGSNLVLSGIVGTLMAVRFGVVGLIVGGVVVGAAVGALNGFVYTKLKIPSIIVTVGLMMIYECVGMFLSGGILNLPSGSKQLGSMPWNMIVCAISFVIAICLVDFTNLGVYSRAIGSNEHAVWALGANVNRYKFMAFTMCGMFAGIASALTVSYSSSISPQLNMATMERNFLPLMGCFVGVALRKYINPIFAIIIGELSISMIITGLMTNGIDATLQKVVVGLTLLIIVAMTANRSREAVVK